VGYQRNVLVTKWLFHNKQDEHGVITRNRARLVAKGYSQVECLDFDETFAPVARLESIRILLAYATHHDFKLYQIDVKSGFLNGPIKEGVYVEQHSGFEDEEYPNQEHGMNVLGIFLLKMVLGLVMWIPLFTRKMDKDLFVCQIYVDDIIFALLIPYFVKNLARS
jgi:hypothetical protein